MYKLLKEKINSSECVGDERAVYEECLKFNCAIFFEPKDCFLNYNHFGISVIPNIYKHKKHSGVVLRRYIDDTLHSVSGLLVHQVYLHDLVKFKWKHETNEFKVSFAIECIRKKSEITKL